MNDLISSLKSDLLDRRLLPLLVLLGLALAAAVAYSVLGGSGTTSAPSAAVGRPGRSPAGSAAGGASLSVSQATADPHAAVAETTEGVSYQHRSGVRNPFKPLASAHTSSTTTSTSPSTASSTSSQPSSSSSTPPASSGTGGATTTTPTEPTAPAKPRAQKPKTVYVVDVLYGLAPTTPGQLSQLTPYAGLKRSEPLPSASDPRIVFAGVSDTGNGAVFTLAGEAILKGEGVCMPSATQCEAIVLAAGRSEQFEYVELNGQSVTYELRVVSIAKRQASAATAARLNRRDHAGEALMRRLAPAVLDHLRFSSAKGVLVYVTHRGAWHK
jgi:hypothetical protein